MAHIGHMTVVTLIVLATVRANPGATALTITKRLRKRFANEPDEWVRNQLCDDTKVNHKLARLAEQGHVRRYSRNAQDTRGAVRILYHHEITEAGRRTLDVAKRFLETVGAGK